MSRAGRHNSAHPRKNAQEPQVGGLRGSCYPRSHPIARQTEFGGRPGLQGDSRDRELIFWPASHSTENRGELRTGWLAARQGDVEAVARRDGDVFSGVVPAAPDRLAGGTIEAVDAVAAL